MEQMTITPLRMNEWEQVKTAAKNKFSDEVGGYPSRKDVKSKMVNPNKITWVIWVAVFVLAVLTVFTSIKVGAIADPFSEKLLDVLSDHTYVAQWIQDLFKLSAIALFILLATPALIYFKLLDSEEEIEKMKKDTAHLRKKGWRSVFALLNLKWVTPRIPQSVVVISVIWLIIVSGYGVETDTSFWVIERWLPVLVEVGLAYTIGQIALSQTAFNQLVDVEHSKLVAMYESRMDGYETDKAYLTILSRYLRKAIYSVSRRGNKPNAWVETADNEVVNQVLLDEYLRLTSGDTFAETILNGDMVKPIQTIQEQAQPTGKRLPPKGAENWTVTTLINDFRARGLDPTSNYNQLNLDEDYGGKGSRTAFRNGAKKYFTIHHS